MDFGQIFTLVMLIFSLIGALDRCFGCKFGPGRSFEEGFGTMGPLVLAMVGINTVAPLLSKYLAPVLTPLCQTVGIDPSIVAGMLLANDSGGWPLAMALTQDREIGLLSGSIIGSVMGTSVMFTIPVAFSAAPAEKGTGCPEKNLCGPRERIQMAEIHYLISDASKKVDVEAHVLRYWEEELELSIPRTEMGHRYYTEFHVRLFQQVKQLKEKGYQLKAIKAALLKTMEDGSVVPGEVLEEDVLAALKETGIGEAENGLAAAAAGEDGNPGKMSGAVGEDGAGRTSGYEKDCICL